MLAAFVAFLFSAAALAGCGCRNCKCADCSGNVNAKAFAWPAPRHAKFFAAPVVAWPVPRGDLGVVVVSRPRPVFAPIVQDAAAPLTIFSPPVRCVNGKCYRGW